MFVEADQILADLAAFDADYRLSFYAVEPEWLGYDLDVPADGRVHDHGDPRGRMLHLPQSYRFETIREASRGFSSPFIAVVRNPADQAKPVGHAVIVHGANIASEMLRAPLHVLMHVRRLSRLPFGAFLGMGSDEGEWSASSPEVMTEIVEHFQLRVEAEAVLATEPYASMYPPSPV